MTLSHIQDMIFIGFVAVGGEAGGGNATLKLILIVVIVTLTHLSH